MTALETLKAARELIVDPKTWCQRTDAMRKFEFTPGSVDRIRCEAEDPLAQCFCAMGALRRVESSFRFTSRARHYLEGAASQLYGTIPTAVNDMIGHAAVLTMYDYAIATLTEDETP